MHFRVDAGYSPPELLVLWREAGVGGGDGVEGGGKPGQCLFHENSMRAVQREAQGLYIIAEAA